MSKQRYFRLAKEGSWILSGQIVSVIGMLLLVRVLTAYLNPAEYGQLALGLTVGALVCQLSMSSVTQGIMRFYAIAAEQGQLKPYFSASVRLMAYGTLGTLVLGMLVSIGARISGQGQWLGLIVMAIIFTQLGSYHAALGHIQNAARQRIVVALHSGLEPYLKLLFVMLLAHWFGATASLAALGYAMSNLVILGSQSIFIRRLLPKRKPARNSQHIQWMQRMWSYSAPFTIFSIFTWMQASSDRWALQTFSTTDDVGLYAVLMQLGYSPIIMVVGLITSFIGPILNARSGDATDASRIKNVHDITWRLTLMCLFLTLIAFAVGQALHALIFNLFVAPQYRRVSYLLPWIFLTGGLFAASQLLYLKLMSELNTKAITLPKVITSIIGVGLNFIGAYYAGLEGIVAAGIAFALLHFIWVAHLAKRKAVKTQTLSISGV